MKKIIALALVAALSIAAPGAFAKKKKAEGTAQPRVENNLHDFGYIKEDGGPVSCEFVLHNDGDGALIIYDATAQCGCTRPEYPKNPISAGKSAKVKVTYNPSYRPGAFMKTVTLKTNGKPRKVTLKIKGIVKPRAKK